MSFNTFSGGGAASPVNPDYLPEVIGVGDGSGTTITGNASAHVIGTYTQLAGAGGSGVTVNDWDEFIAEFSAPSGASNRYLARVSIDGGSNLLLPPFLVMPSSTTTRVQRFRVPMQVPAGSDVRIAVSSSAASSATIKAVIRGLSSQGASNPPGYTTATALVAADTAATRASSTSVAASNDATSYTQLIASTAAQYGAFMVFFGSGANPSNSQGVFIRLGKGAALSEIPIGGAHAWFGGAGQMNGFTATIDAVVAASQRISLNIQGASADSTIAGCIAFS